MNFVVGRVWHPIEEQFRAVIGYEYSDSPGYFQFYTVNGSGHFRKRPESMDTVHSISKVVFNAIKETR